MKFSIKKLLVSGVLAGAMTFCAAGAANFESAAQSLNDLGLLTGTDNGFDLDRASTRGEAAAMLVRLLGKSAEADEAWKTDADSFAFTDMEDSAWAKPAVNWLVKNNLAAGTTETTFAPRESCSAQMAATFLLRALGYSDAEGGDFTYFTAMDFAREKGVVDLFNCNEKDFQRDHLVAMCYTALSCQPKGGEGDLLDKLIADGAVADNDASKAVRQKFADYREYMKASESFQSNSSMACKVTADIDITAEGDTMKMTMEQDAAMKIDPAKLEAVEMKMAGKVDVVVEDETVSVPNTLYFKDGMAYIEADGNKMKMPMDFKEAMSQMNVVNMQSVNNNGSTVIDSLTKAEADGKTTYTVTYNPNVMGSAVDSIMGSMMAAMPDLSNAGAKVSITKVTANETIQDGVPVSMDMDMVMNVNDGQSEIGMSMKMKMDITATGDAVKIEFPDSFDDYVDASAATATVTTTNTPADPGAKDAPADTAKDTSEDTAKDAPAEAE